MQLSQSLNIKQKQSLVMTPQLQQAINLLQLTNLELKQFLEEQTLTRSTSLMCESLIRKDLEKWDRAGRLL